MPGKAWNWGIVSFRGLRSCRKHRMTLNAVITCALLPRPSPRSGPEPKSVDNVDIRKASWNWDLHFWQIPAERLCTGGYQVAPKHLSWHFKDSPQSARQMLINDLSSAQTSVVEPYHLKMAESIFALEVKQPVNIKRSSVFTDHWIQVGVHLCNIGHKVG